MTKETPPAGSEPQANNRARLSSLPVSLPPRGLSRVQASEYVGVSPSHFDKLVRDRVFPPAKRLAGRVIWDRKQLDRALDALDGEWNNDESDDWNGWDRSLHNARAA